MHLKSLCVLETSAFLSALPNMMSLYARAIAASTAAAGITGGLGLGIFAWEARPPQTRFQTFCNTIKAFGVGALVGIAAGPFLFPFSSLNSDVVPPLSR